MTTVVDNPTAQSWPTMRVDLKELFAAHDRIVEHLPRRTAALTDAQITKFHRTLERALDLCREHKLSDYQLQVSTYARFDGASQSYPSVFIESSGHDTTMWLGIAQPRDIHQGPLVARVHTSERRPGLARWGHWLYITETPLVAPLHRSTNAHSL